MGDFEIISSGVMESSLEYHPYCIGFLTAYETRCRTVLGGQFDWGGRLPKSNGGARRSPQGEWKTPRERKGIRWLNCETDRSSRNESWS